MKTTEKKEKICANCIHVVWKIFEQSNYCVVWNISEKSNYCLFGKRVLPEGTCDKWRGKEDETGL